MFIAFHQHQVTGRKPRQMVGQSHVVCGWQGFDQHPPFCRRQQHLPRPSLPMPPRVATQRVPVEVMVGVLDGSYV